MPLEDRFDAPFTASLALREKQIQQSYRPVIGVHKWFARRPGTLFRNLLLAEFNGAEGPERGFFRAHHFSGVIADPFMGGGTPLIEANRLGFHVVGTDINPMACWIVRQELSPLDDRAFCDAAEAVARGVEEIVRDLYRTRCVRCGEAAAVKYFLWVKVQACPECGNEQDLFPGYLLAEATRHPKHVLACGDCGELVELDNQPRRAAPASCPACGGCIHVEGPAQRNRVECRVCRHAFRYPPEPAAEPPKHRMWAIEYHCVRCRPRQQGRLFKKPDAADQERFDAACAHYSEKEASLPIPADEVPVGDETRRLHRWGYHRYRDMFNERQLLGLGTLLRSIEGVTDAPVRHSLLTVFSDFLRYQNLLCRYDTYALKCQDIFSVHGFPVGLVQCENNLLGTPGVGGGGFRHFIEKFRKAKAYCRRPFETRQHGRSKERVHISGEKIEAALVTRFPAGKPAQALVMCASAADFVLEPGTLDGVFTDPPYYDNVQYAELIDFCYVWLRHSLRREFPDFRGASTRDHGELTGNVTMGRGLEHFSEGLSRVFRRFADALKSGAPFVFTYHHNDVSAYAPLVLALLDAELHCTAVLPAPAEMTASLHINNTASSILDSVFVCRRIRPAVVELPEPTAFREQLLVDCRAVAEGGVRVTVGDIRCLLSGHIARLAVNSLAGGWDRETDLASRLRRIQTVLGMFRAAYDSEEAVSHVFSRVNEPIPEAQLRLLDGTAVRARI